MYTLADFIRKSAVRFPDKEAVVFEDIRLTYGELNNRTNALANSLTKMGYKKGDRIAILAENSHRYFEVYFAVAKLGMSVSPLNFRLAGKELEYIVNDSDATGFFVGIGYEESVLSMKSKLNKISDWVALDRSFDGYINYEDLLENASTEEPDIDLGDDDLVILMYTGGTTGLPKGVMFSNRTITTAITGYTVEFSLNETDITCFILPLFHVSFWPALCVLFSGGTVVLNKRPEVAEILKTIQNEKCTHINAAPTIYRWLIQDPDIGSYDLSSLKKITYGGSPMAPEILKECIKVFGNIFNQIYGMTEVLGATILRARDHHVEGERSKLLLSVGKEMISADIKVVDYDDNKLPPGKIGEIALKGKHVMMGYWKNPEMTAEVMQNGWYHTGDLGYMDENDYLFLVDRKADMIVTGGENVYPKETEDVLYEHETVMECAVVSAPDEKWGERVQAVVILKEGQSVTEEELIAHCKKRLAGYKCPKSIEFWDELPKTPIGKIQRKEVKKVYWKGKDRTIG